MNHSVTNRYEARDTDRDDRQDRSRVRDRPERPENQAPTTRWAEQRDGETGSLPPRSVTSSRTPPSYPPPPDDAPPRPTEFRGRFSSNPTHAEQPYSVYDCVR